MNSTRVNRIKDKAFKVFGICCTMLGLVVLAVFIIDILMDGLPRLDIDFLTSLPSRRASKAGIKTAWAGTAWILGLTTMIAFPLGVMAGIYLEEYGKKSRWASFLEVNIANLAGVPSVIYGLLGLQIFGRVLGLGNSLLSGALTLSLLILPIVIVATREALRAVPKTVKEASLAMGATKWQTIYHQMLPASMGGIITGSILALSRAVGETAPLIVIGALAYVPFVPKGPMDEFTVLPIQVFNWVSRPQKEFLVNAAAAIIVLLAITLLMNGIAIYLRNRWQRKVKW
ncbi:MAG: phosphate ABC transporter permease PstA [Flavobacteriales bacterium]|nr:phosphate ABC transporter permease PstA [Flavobacteriales bacterium]MCB9446846.1 phosphate ABC transporter permease PstA [Flavobacteriales bacterium]